MGRRGRGEGSIEVLPSGKFRVVISAGIGPGGKRRKLTRTFLTKKEATAWRAERLEEQRRGVVSFAGSLTLAEWLVKWVESKKATTEPHTHAFYSRIRGKLDSAIPAGLQIGRMTRLDVEAIYAHLATHGASRDAIRKAAITLSSAFNDAVDRGLIPRNPCRRIKLPRHEKREVKPWTPEQCRAFLAVAEGDRLAALFPLALDTGMRPGELLGLHWPEIDWGRRIVRVEWTLEYITGGYRLKRPKTKKSRRAIVVCSHTLEYLRRHREAMRVQGRNVTTGPVFVNLQGGWIDRSTFSRKVNGHARTAGIPPLNPHGLRHTNATLLLQAGVNVRLVSERLGHEDIRTTLQLYAHVLDADQGLAARAVAGILYVSPTGVPPGGGG